MASSQQGQYVSKEQKKAQKSLEAARQAGTIPAEKDEDGNDINPHMPKYIVNAPWYVDDSKKPTLKHQKWFKQDEKISMDKWYARGQRGHQATSFRKGACENCGALTHKAKDCCERPRKKGAKVTGKDIKADEILVDDLKFNYDSKRDRYNGYDPSEYMKVMEEHDKYEAMRKIQNEEMKKKKKELKKQEREQKRKENQEKNGEENENIEENEETSDSEEEEEDKEPVQKVDYSVSLDDNTKTYRRLYNVVKQEKSAFRQTSQLRIREDRAVYLENLDENSAFYDPKSRTMRENPNPHLPEEEQNYKGLNYVRHTGDAPKILEQEVFAWQRVQNNESTIGSVSVPSATEKFFKAQKQEDIDKKNQKLQELNEKYGGAEHFKSQQEILKLKQEDSQLDELEQLEQQKQNELNQKLKNVATSQNTNVNQMKQSKYPEDQFQHGHTAIWGSWWNETLGWGYACCHGTDKLTYCEGPKAKGLAVIREYKAKEAAEKKLKEFEQKQKQLNMIQEEDDENEDEEEEDNNKKEEENNNNQQEEIKKPQIQQEQQIDIENENLNENQKQNKSKSNSASENESSSSSDSDSDSSSSSSDSDSDSSSDSESGSNSDSNKNIKKNKVQQKADKKEKEKKSKYLKELNEEQVKKALEQQKEKENKKRKK